MMPEDFIIYRFYFEGNGLAREWQSLYYDLTIENKSLLLETIKNNRVDLVSNQNYSNPLNKILSYYEIEYAPKKKPK